MKILVLCTGNSIRSQMAEGFLKSFDPSLDVASAGTYPARRVHPYAIQVMNEIGIDISTAYPKSVDEFIRDSFDYVITVCDHANESCPVFRGKVGQRLHIGFRDPVSVIGTPDDVLASFRDVRDEIKKKFFEFYTSNIKQG
jgi:arsenate reductase (thioredoxin)